ncbi:DUF5990 family protein [Mesorhizobium sp. B2-3-4]|uniref:DUF5990 family protein n=1 Tax=Mesorhizobium sp. B2-3-4 TaxID=2589959 RepID=UPI001128454F|nr:DUF5990 family protein [Mesorhizobium sp. B2-3-4]TPM40492.1 hypothetical protein FJ967_03885 [Mesorhizobium sp. B2-3-4]
MKPNAAIRLLHDGRQPGAALPERFEFGLQMKSGEVLAGKPCGRELLRFDILVVLREGPDGELDYSGPAVHGGPCRRFLYLSWKRARPDPSWWGCRIKIPLRGIALLVAKPASELSFEANVVDRRPHDTTPISWLVGDAWSGHRD